MAEVNSASSRYHEDLNDVLDSIVTDLTAIRTVLGGILSGSDTWDASSIATAEEESKDITVTGAAVGDFVLVSPSIDITDLVLTASVTAEDTVTAVLANNTGSAVDLGSMTVYVRVIPKDSFAAPSALTTSTD